MTPVCRPAATGCGRSARSGRAASSNGVRQCALCAHHPCSLCCCDARSNRLWTLRTQRPCRVWQLRGPSLRAALRMYPDTVDRALEFVRGRLTAWMEGRPEDEVRLSVGSRGLVCLQCLTGAHHGRWREAADRKRAVAVVMQHGEVGSPLPLANPSSTFMLLTHTLPTQDGTWCELVQLLKRCLVAGPLRDRIHDCYLALQLVGGWGGGRGAGHSERGRPDAGAAAGGLGFGGQHVHRLAIWASSWPGAGVLPGAAAGGWRMQRPAEPP